MRLIVPTGRFVERPTNQHFSYLKNILNKNAEHERLLMFASASKTSLICTERYYYMYIYIYIIIYTHNRYKKYLPTCFDTPWVPSSGSLHNS
jgi:hypothetical protein